MLPISATTTILGQVVMATPISVPITTPTPTGEPRPHSVCNAATETTLQHNVVKYTIGTTGTLQ